MPMLEQNVKTTIKKYLNCGKRGVKTCAIRLLVFNSSNDPTRTQTKALIIMIEKINHIVGDDFNIPLIFVWGCSHDKWNRSVKTYGALG